MVQTSNYPGLLIYHVINKDSNSTNIRPGIGTFYFSEGADWVVVTTMQTFLQYCRTKRGSNKSYCISSKRVVNID